MAFQSVSQNTGRIINPAKDLEVGASVEGYVTSFGQGKHGPIINMKTSTGEAVSMFTSGNLRWAVTDEKIKLALLTRVTRIPDIQVKGMNSSQFDIEQDSNQTLEEADFSAVFASEPTPADARKASTTAAIERNSVAQRASDLAKAAKANKRT